VEAVGNVVGEVRKRDRLALDVAGIKHVEAGALLGSRGLPPSRGTKTISEPRGGCHSNERSRLEKPSRKPAIRNTSGSMTKTMLSEVRAKSWLKTG